MRTRRSTSTALVLGGLLLGGGCSEPSSLSCPPADGDVFVFDNPPEGRWAAEGASPRLSEEWRVPLPAGTRWPAPDAAWVDADGTVMFADLRLGAILALDPAADTGPSENPLPAEVVTAIAGAVLDVRLPPPVFRPLSAGGFLVVLPPGPAAGGADQRRISFVVRMAVDGSSPDTLSAASVAVLNDHGFVEWPRPGTRIPLVAVGPGDAVALAGASSAYRIDILRADLTDSLVVCRRAAALPLTETEVGESELPDSPSHLAWLLRGSKKVQPSLPFGRLFLGSGGRLWVQRERPDPQRVYAQPGGAAYDLFASGGEYLGEVRAPEGVVLIGEAAGLVYGLEAVEGASEVLLAYALD